MVKKSSVVRHDISLAHEGIAKFKSRLVNILAQSVIRSTIRPLWSSKLPITWQRSITGALLNNGWVPRAAKVSETTLGGIRTELLVPATGAGEQVIFYVHGGGYVVCSPRTHRPLTSRLTLALNATTYVPHYRLAPEQPFPAGLEDVLAAYQGLLANGINASNVVIMGDSAGGGLALALTLSIRDKGLPLPAKLMLISPWVDLTLVGETLHSKNGIDPMLTWDWIVSKTPDYLGATAATNPLVSPLFADLTGLPPTLVQVGSEEILLSDSERLAVNAAAAGWALTLTVWQGMWHDFQLLGSMVPEADAAIAAITRFVRGEALI